MGATAGAGAAAAAAAAAANVIKAMGVVVKVSPEAFQSIANRAGDALVVHTTGGMFSKHHRYLTSYKGLAFHTKSDNQLSFAAKTELLEAEKMWMPE